MRETRRTIRIAGFHAVRLRLCAGLGLTVLLALMCGLTGRSQSSGSNGGQGQGQGNMHPFTRHDDLSSTSDDDLDPMTYQRRMRALNIQRQKQMVSDTDKLLKLAKELNDEVAAQNASTLTLDELHKVAEIEKLAHNVRQRMTEGAGVPQTAIPASPPIAFPAH